MATPTGTHFVVSAVATSSGAPVYRRADGTWASDVHDAHPAADEAERDRMLAAARGEEREVCDPYAFPVQLDGDRVVLLTVRERIRAAGPTVPVRRPDKLSKSA